MQTESVAVLPSVIEKSQSSDWLFTFGAGDEARTRYLHLGKVALYRMSYARSISVSNYSISLKYVNDKISRIIIYLTHLAEI